MDGLGCPLTITTKRLHTKFGEGKIWCLAYVCIQRGILRSSFKVRTACVVAERSVRSLILNLRYARDLKLRCQARVCGQHTGNLLVHRSVRGSIHPYTHPRRYYLLAHLYLEELAVVSSLSTVGVLFKTAIVDSTGLQDSVMSLCKSKLIIKSCRTLYIPVSRC
jgi:hypothetical protein